jgi:tetratricopeptide (TPR) repeat protein
MSISPSSIEAPPRDYWCFISYRHADNHAPGREWATWLHQAIETYEVPEDLIGKVNEWGHTIPARLYPVFRDEEELPADAELAAPIQRALKQSRFLVVICSPAAVQSSFVNDEIRTFKMLGKAKHTLAMIIRGEPNVSRDPGKLAAGFTLDDECFPASLRASYDAKGHLLDEKSEPIGADFRLPDGSEGWTTAIAYRQQLIEQGLKSRDIAKRVAAFEQRQQLMKLKIIAGILGVSLGVLTERDKSYQLAIARRRAKVLRRWLAVVSVLSLLMLAASVTAYFMWQHAERQRRHAVFEKEEAEKLIDYMVGDLQEKVTPLGSLGLVKSIHQRVDSYYRTHGEAGRTNQTLARRATFFDKLGNQQLAEKAFRDAGESYHAALEIRESLALREPKNAEWQWAMSVSYSYLGDLQIAQGDSATAAKYYHISRKMVEKIIAVNPIRRQWQFFLAALHQKLGDIERQQKQWDAALASYQKSLAICKEITPASGDADSRLRLSECHRRLGQLKLDQEEYAAALEEYKASLEIVQKLTQDAPDQSSYQHDLGNAHDDVAKTYRKLRQWEAALTHFQKLVVISEKLVKSRPTESRYHLALGWAYWGMASVLEEVRPEEAQDAWRLGLLVFAQLEQQGVGLPAEVRAARERAQRLLKP